MLKFHTSESTYLLIYSSLNNMFPPFKNVLWSLHTKQQSLTVFEGQKSQMTGSHVLFLNSTFPTVMQISTQNSKILALFSF